MNESFKALADPTRRQIIRLLREKDRTAGEIADYFQMSKPSISHHLSALKHAGLVQDERKGQFIVYSLNTTVLEEVLGWFLELTGTGKGSRSELQSDKEDE
jgi:DNA-binding transcriptional ArsR family regulator